MRRDKDGNKTDWMRIIPKLWPSRHVCGPSYDDRDYRVMRHIAYAWLFWSGIIPLWTIKRCAEYPANWWR